MPRRLSHAKVVDALRAWANGHDLHVKAAVRAIIEQDFALRRREFVDAAVRVTSDGAYLSFRDARKAFDEGQFLPASSTELGLLDLAIAVGEDRFGFSRMGPETSSFALGLLNNALGPQASRANH